MAAELKVPSLGMDMEEASIVRWLVEEGAEVAKGEPVLEIDTDKTTFEIESPADGVIRNLHGAAGETVPVGARLAFIAAPGEEVPKDTPREPQSATPERDEPGKPPEPAVSGGPRPEANGKRAVVRASPAARRAALERGVRIDDVAGSGPSGRVYLSDVLEADVRQPAGEPVPEVPDGSAGPSRRESLSRVRRLGAERTARSFREAPHFYLTRDFDAARLVELRERLKRRLDPAPSMTALISLALARTLRDHPRLNARYADGALEVQEQVNLGVAVATDAGLVVPVLKNADELPLKELASRLGDLTVRAREGRLGPDELSGGSFTLSNLGMMEIDSFGAIINAPEAAILAVGRVRTVPEWRDEEWVPKPVISGTLSVDHRVADGADGAGFLMALQTALSDWELLL